MANFCVTLNFETLRSKILSECPERASKLRESKNDAERERDDFRSSCKEWFGQCKILLRHKRWYSTNCLAGLDCESQLFRR